MAGEGVTGAGTAVLRLKVIKADGRVIDYGIVSTTRPRWYDLKGRAVLRAMKKLEG